MIVVMADVERQCLIHLIRIMYKSQKVCEKSNQTKRKRKKNKYKKKSFIFYISTNMKNCRQ